MREKASDHEKGDTGEVGGNEGHKQRAPVLLFPEALRGNGCSVHLGKAQGLPSQHPLTLSTSWEP